MTIDFWDVGQGDCTVITKDDGTLTVIDVGPAASPLVSWFADHPEKTISEIILTHNDADHIGAMRPLIQDHVRRIDTVYLLKDGPRTGPRQKSVRRNLEPLRDAVRNRQIIAQHLNVGQALWTDSNTGASLQVLYPSVLDNIVDNESPNQGSAILALRHPNGNSILWPGDNTVSRASEVNAAESVAWLFGPHHGAPEDCGRPNRKLFKEPLTGLNPERAFISVGTNNRYNHPNPRYLAHLQGLGCGVSCSQLTRWCDRKIKERQPGAHVVNGSALIGLRKIDRLFSCRGSLRLHITVSGIVEDENSSKHREAVQNLTHPHCLPRSSWKRC